MVVQYILFVGYLLAFILHIASCGLLYRFVEFSLCSCCIGKCGYTIDLGGPDGHGFKHGRRGIDIIFPLSRWDGDGGDGGGDGGGDVGGG